MTRVPTPAFPRQPVGNMDQGQMDGQGGDGYACTPVADAKRLAACPGADQRSADRAQPGARGPPHLQAFGGTRSASAFATVPDRGRRAQQALRLELAADRKSVV